MPFSQPTGHSWGDPEKRPDESGATLDQVIAFVQSELACVPADWSLDCRLGYAIRAVVTKFETQSFNDFVSLFLADEGKTVYFGNSEAFDGCHSLEGWQVKLRKTHEVFQAGGDLVAQNKADGTETNLYRITRNSK